MDALCRLCGSSDGIRVRIFDPETDYVKRIHKVLPISINEHDPFPKTMCHKCSFKVNEFFEFRTKCIEAQEMFRRKIPWLKHTEKEMHTANPPMVEVHLNQLNSISPNEKEMRPPKRLIDESDPMIVIDDSPPYKDEPLLLNVENQNLPQKKDLPRSTQNIAKKKTKPRTIWDSKKRKRKPKKDTEQDSQPNFQIAEVFTTSMEEYQVIDSVEHDPLDISQNQSTNERCLAENSSSSINGASSSTNDISKAKPNDTNLTLPKNILITKIPQVGLVYTCELCGRTFLSPGAGASHTCDFQESSEDEKVERKPVVGPDNRSPPDYYTCDICSKIFSRQSQLTFHSKTHVESVSSASESVTTKNKKRKYKKKSKINTNLDLKTNEYSYLTMVGRSENNINRHSLLSSESD